MTFEPSIIIHLTDGRFNLSMDNAVLPGACEYSTVACRVGIQLALISSGGFCVSVLYQAASSSPRFLFSGGMCMRLRIRQHPARLDVHQAA